jgi:polyphosphate glucokinase
VKVLVIDVGGSHIKVLATGRKTPLKIPSGPKMTASQMVRRVREAIDGWTYNAVSIGYAGVVLHGKPMSEPRNLGRGLGRLQVQEGVPVSGHGDQRRGHAGARQL